MFEKLVVTGVVTPVCSEFEGRFLASNREDVPVVRLRYLIADLVKRQLSVLEVKTNGLMANVTVGRPRTGILLGGIYEGFVVRQISKDGGFFIARSPQLDQLSSWYAERGIALADVPTYTSDDFWDQEFALRKTPRTSGPTLLLDLGER